MSKKQSLRFRLIAYPLLAVIFVVCAYFIAISAMGYKVYYRNGHLEKERTGSIILSSRPGDSQIFLDGRIYPKKTPALSFLSVQINGLNPRKYQIKLEKKDYETWIGAFDVYSGMVSWGTQILLLPQKRSASAYNMPKEIEFEISSSDKTRILVVTRDKENQSITISQLNTSNKNKQTILEKRLEVSESYRPLSYSDDKQRVLFERTLGDKKSYFVMSTNENPETWEVSETFKKDFDSYTFNPKNHDDLYGLKSGDLFKISYVSKTMSGVLYSNVVEVYSLNQNLYFVQKGEKYSSLYQVDGTTGKSLVIRSLPAAESYQISFLSNDFGYGILPNTTKVLATYRPNGNPDIKPKIISDNVDYFLPSSEYQFLGYGKAGGFYCYDLERSRYYTTFENRKISSIAWLDDQFNLAYIENGQLKMITYNGYYDKNIFEAKNEFPVFASQDSPLLFFTAENKEKKRLDLFTYGFNG